MSTLFLDIDTQIDFMFPAGALYVPGAESILPQIAELNRFAVQSGALLISTADSHTENDPEFHKYPPHCVVGTVGQLKPGYTNLGQRVLEKQVLDIFATPQLDRILDEVRPERVVVYGVVTELCVRCAVEGLTRRGGIQIEVVTDAVRSLADTRGEEALAEFQGQGASLTTANRVLAKSV